MLGLLSAVALAALFLVAGVWKLTEPFEAAARMVQAKVPANLGLFTAVSFGIAEVFAGMLLLIPRFRRWGAWLTGLMLVAFMIYVGWHYEALAGADCSCFPWIKRAVGPGFFIGDGLMLLLAVFAGWWARRSESMRGAAIILGAVAVFGLASVGVTYARQSGAEAPESIQVNAQPYSLRTGRQLIYFFDPECSHCFQAAKTMAGYRWKDTAIVGVPTVNPRFAPTFLKETGLKAQLSSDHDKLKQTFPFTNAPFAVAIEHGRQKGSWIGFEDGEPEASLRKLGFVE